MEQETHHDTEEPVEWLTNEAIDTLHAFNPMTQFLFRQCISGSLDIKKDEKSYKDQLRKLSAGAMEVEFLFKGGTASYDAILDSPRRRDEYMDDKALQYEVERLKKVLEERRTKAADMLDAPGK